MKVLITGATGNIGLAVIKKLRELHPSIAVIAGVRSIEKAGSVVSVSEATELRLFDFEDDRTYDQALKDVDIVFLLRPPKLSDVDRYFAPLIRLIAARGAVRIMFLSVQGAEQSKVIPHRKIELLIQGSGLDYIFLRPAYFMQNLTTTLNSEVKEERTISLPSGRAKFNWVDIEDIAEVAVDLMCSFQSHRNKAFVISGKENLDFNSVVGRINRICATNITYQSVGPFAYYRLRRKEGMSTGMILVTFALHFLPRLQREPEIVPSVEALLGKEPRSIDAFIANNKRSFV